MVFGGCGRYYAMFISLVLASFIVGCITSPLDVQVEYLDYDLYYDNDSIETSCLVKMERRWSLVIHGWVAYSSNEGSGRLEKTQRIGYDGYVILCFPLPVDLNDVTNASYGFYWSDLDDSHPPYQVNDTILLQGESPETPPQSPPSTPPEVQVCGINKLEVSGILNVYINYEVKNPFPHRQSIIITQPYVKYWIGSTLTEILVNDTLRSYTVGPNASVIPMEGDVMANSHSVALEGIEPSTIERLVAGVRNPEPLPQWLSDNYPNAILLNISCEKTLIPPG